MLHWSIWVKATVIAGLGLAAVARAEQPLPTMLEGVGVDEKIGRNIDLNLTFTAENGYPVALRQFFNQGRPVILNLVYYPCPMLCNLVMNGQTAALREIPWTIGNEFEVVTISIDPSEDVRSGPTEEAGIPGQLRACGRGMAFSCRS